MPEDLHLKIDCPVLLLKNLSDTLVNGLRGKVRKLSKDLISVYFDTLAKEIELKPEIFPVYCATEEKVVATRIQFPICLAFSITIHKAQGLTLDRIEVNANNIFSAGQLGVAIGRTTAKKNLRIINFHPSAVIKHDKSIYDFYESIESNEDAVLGENQMLFVPFDVETNISSDVEHKQDTILSSGDELSDFNEQELEEIEQLEHVEIETAHDEISMQIS